MEPDAVVDALIETIERADLDGMADLYALDAVQQHPMADEPVRGRDAIRQSEAARMALDGNMSVAGHGPTDDRPSLEAVAPAAVSARRRPSPAAAPCP